MSSLLLFVLGVIAGYALAKPEQVAAAYAAVKAWNQRRLAARRAAKG